MKTINIIFLFLFYVFCFKFSPCMHTKQYRNLQKDFYESERSDKYLIIVLEKHERSFCAYFCCCCCNKFMLKIDQWSTSLHYICTS